MRSCGPGGDLRLLEEQEEVFAADDRALLIGGAASAPVRA